MTMLRSARPRSPPGRDHPGPVSLISAPVGGAGPDECREERMRVQGPALELGVELAAQEEGVVLQFHDLHEDAVGAHAREYQALVLQGLLVLVVELVAMSMPLADLGGAVGFGGLAVRCEATGIGA